MPEIKHRPWLNQDLYNKGLDGQRIAIVGYSHHRNAEHVDHDDFKITVLGNVLSGAQPGDSFFSAIPTYFGIKDRKYFWELVLFFNLLPSVVGTSAEKYKSGSLEQIEAGKIRFGEIMAEHQPDCTLVFTRKGWEQRPSTLEEQKGRSLESLMSYSKFEWGTYQCGKRVLPAFGLRHPQYASTSKMKAAVEKALKIAGTMTAQYEKTN